MSEITVDLDKMVAEHGARISYLEETVSDLTDSIKGIQKKLEEKATNDARIAQVVENTNKKVEDLNAKVDRMSEKLLDAVLEQYHDEREARQEAAKDNREFYQRLILIALTVVVSIILSAFGVKEIIKL